MVEELLLNETESYTPAPSERAPARIKVIGVGGGGCNCIRRMMLHSKVPGVSFAMVNTDIKALETHDHEVDLIQIGEKSTRGWGAGGDFKVGARAATESATGLRRALSNAELVFITRAGPISVRMVPVTGVVGIICIVGVALQTFSCPDRLLVNSTCPLGDHAGEKFTD